MNRSGDAACRRSCLQQPETFVRSLGPHRQDRLRILHPITYVIAILCFHGAARDWRQADTMQAEGARSDGGRCAGGGSAGRDVGGHGERGGGRGWPEVVRDGRGWSWAVEGCRGRSEAWRAR